MLAAWPGHWANTNLRLSADAASAASSGLPHADLSVATANVVAWGGHAALFSHFLAAGTAADPDSDHRYLASLAGWRAGAVGLRAQALALLADLPPVGAAAALGFEPSELVEFADRQHHDPYWWSGRPAAGGMVLRAGGFAGLGGRWVVPPTDAGRGPVSGSWFLASGDDWWRLDADVFGSVLTPVNGTPEVGPDTDAAGVRITTFRESYLVLLSVPAEAT